MQKKKLLRIRRTAVALASVLVLAAGGAAVSADDSDITMDNDSIDSGDGDTSYSGGSLELEEGGALFEDTGSDVQYNAGVPMDTLQKAMESGDTKTLEKIASLGALTGSQTTSGSGVGGGGAYRGANSDEDDEDYYDLNLDEGDADETQTEKPGESPGPLLAANPERLQEHLDAMTEVDSPTGSDGELTVAAYIETKMGEMGYTVQEQAFHEGVLNEDGVDAPGINILAERGANSQENRKKDIFLVVTHYDSKRSPSEDDPFANDKSGAAALIEAARILSEVVTDTDICFVFLSGQEDGGYGAQNFIGSLSEENRSRISGVLSVERVGYDSDTPYVLKTLTGESNSLGDIVQQLGITNDAYLSSRAGTTGLEEDVGTWVAVGQSSDGYIDEATAAQIAAQQSGTGIDDQNAIDIESADYLAQGDDPDAYEMELDEEETEAEPVPMPSAWSYLKDASPTMSTFGGASYPAVTLSQYMPELDSASYEETKALGLADTTLEAINQAQALVLGESMAGTQETSADGTAAGTIQLQDSNLTGSADETVPLEDAFSLEEGTPEDGASDLPGMEVPEEEAWLPTVDAFLVADTTNVIAATLAKIMDPAT